MAASKERFASCSLRDFHNLQELYRSSSGAVYRATFRYDDKEYVLKERSMPELGRRKDIMNEVNLLLQLSHPNVVNCLGWFRDESKQCLFIVLEYCAGGDLHAIIERRRTGNSNSNGIGNSNCTGNGMKMQYFEEHQIWFVFLQVCRGVRHLHENGIVHRDLKSLNIMCASANARLFKVADLGVSRQVSEQTLMLQSFYGTPLYLSPELVESKPYNEKTDLWSLGVLLYEMSALSTPFKAASLLGVAKLILSCQYQPIPGHYSKYLRRCIAWLLNVDYKKRPNIAQLIEFVEQRQRPGYSGGSKILIPAKTEEPAPAAEEAVAAEAELVSAIDDSNNIQQCKPSAAGAATAAGVVNVVRSRRAASANVDPTPTAAAQRESIEMVRDSLERLPPQILQEQQQPQQQRRLQKQRQSVEAASDDGSVEAANHIDSSSRRRQEGPSDNHKHQQPPQQQQLVRVDRQRLQVLLRKETMQLRKLLKMRDFVNVNSNSRADNSSNSAFISGGSQCSEDRDAQRMQQQLRNANRRQTAHDISEQKAGEEELKMRSLVRAKQQLIAQLEQLLLTPQQQQLASTADKPIGAGVTIPLFLAEHFGLLPASQSATAAAGSRHESSGGVSAEEQARRNALKQQIRVLSAPTAAADTSPTSQRKSKRFDDAKDQYGHGYGVDINNNRGDINSSSSSSRPQQAEVDRRKAAAAETGAVVAGAAVAAAVGASASALEVGTVAPAYKKLYEPAVSSKQVLFSPSRRQRAVSPPITATAADVYAAPTNRGNGEVRSEKDLLAERWECAQQSHCLPAAAMEDRNENRHSSHRRRPGTASAATDRAALFSKHPYAPNNSSSNNNGSNAAARPQSAAARADRAAPAATSLDLESLARLHRRPQHRRMVSDITRMVESTKRRPDANKHRDDNGSSPNRRCRQQQQSAGGQWRASDYYSESEAAVAAATEGEEYHHHHQQQENEERSEEEEECGDDRLARDAVQGSGPESARRYRDSKQQRRRNQRLMMRRADEYDIISGATQQSQA